MTRYQLLLVLAILIAGVSSAAGQSVRGRVVDATTNSPLPGELVQLRDLAGAVVTQQFTSPSGAFSFVVTPGMAYRITVAAIGYARHAPVDVTAAAADAVVPDIGLTVIAIRLPELQALGGQRACGKSQVSPETFGGVLESAHASLEVMDATLHLGQIGFVTRQVSRFTTRVTHDSSRITADTTVGAMHQWPVLSASIDTLKKFGFGAETQSSEGQGYLFWGPDLRVLFSDWFLETHCYRVDAERSRGDTVVIHFEPVKHSSRVDVTGDLVLDRATLTLRRLSYLHQNLPAGFPAGTVGGEMHFSEPVPGYLVPMSWALWTPVTRTTRVIARPGVRTVYVPGQRGVARQQQVVMPPQSVTEVIGRHDIQGELTRIIPVPGS